MNAFIQTDRNNMFYSVNAYVADQGFRSLGWETAPFFAVEEIEDKNPEIVVVGGVATIRQRLADLGIPFTGEEMEYPEELSGYLGRKVWLSTVEEVLKDESLRNIFIKPKETKAFPGKIVRELKDFTGLVNAERPTAVWCSELFSFRTEWRCFVRYGELLDVRQYKGEWDSRIDLQVVRNAISDFKTAPAAYALDFGIDDSGRMALVEVNDGHSLGSYGMGVISYAKFLSARWAELTGTTDYARF